MGMAYLLGSKCRFTAAILNGLLCFLFFFVVDFSLSLYHRKCKTENLDNQTLSLLPLPHLVCSDLSPNYGDFSIRAAADAGRFKI